MVPKQFQSSPTVLGLRERRIDPEFTVAKMVKPCHLQLMWTESLENHLKLDRKDKILWIFPFKYFLSAHLHSSQAMEQYAIAHPLRCCDKNLAKDGLSLRFTAC